MGLRYRKSKKILPGVRLNLNKNSASISIGPKGFKQTFSTTGRKTTTVGIPGSGLSYTTNSSANKSGEPQQATPVYSSKNKTTALILAIIFGWAGVHRFYAGKAGTGILWLLTLGMFCFGWAVDIVKIARGKFTDGHGHIIDRPAA